MSLERLELIDADEVTLTYNTPAAREQLESQEFYAAGALGVNADQWGGGDGLHVLVVVLRPHAAFRVEPNLRRLLELSDRARRDGAVTGVEVSGNQAWHVLSGPDPLARLVLNFDSPIGVRAEILLTADLHEPLWPIIPELDSPGLTLSDRVRLGEQQDLDAVLRPSVIMPAEPSRAIKELRAAQGWALPEPTAEQAVVMVEPGAELTTSGTGCPSTRARPATARPGSSGPRWCRCSAWTRPGNRATRWWSTSSPTACIAPPPRGVIAEAADWQLELDEEGGTFAVRAPAVDIGEGEVAVSGTLDTDVNPGLGRCAATGESWSSSATCRAVEGNPNLKPLVDAGNLACGWGPARRRAADRAPARINWRFARPQRQPVKAPLTPVCPDNHRRSSMGNRRDLGRHSGRGHPADRRPRLTARPRVGVDGVMPSPITLLAP